MRKGAKNKGKKEGEREGDRQKTAKTNEWRSEEKEFSKKLFFSPNF